jgi:hypothetical protein
LLDFENTKKKKKKKKIGQVFIKKKGLKLLHKKDTGSPNEVTYVSHMNVAEVAQE